MSVQTGISWFDTISSGLNPDVMEAVSVRLPESQQVTDDYIYNLARAYLGRMRDGYSLVAELSALIDDVVKRDIVNERGKFLKRFVSVLGVLGLPPVDNDFVGIWGSNIARYSNGGGTYNLRIAGESILSITRNNSSLYGNSGSCWWSSYDGAPASLVNSRGGGILFYNQAGAVSHAHGIGRIWFVPCNGVLLLFNSYVSQLPSGDRLQLHLGYELLNHLAGGGLYCARGDLQGSSNVYVNGQTCLAVSNEPINKSRWAVRWGSRYIVVVVGQCTHCGATVYNDNAERLSVSIDGREHLFCCRNCAEGCGVRSCHFCGRWEARNCMVEGKYGSYCIPCAEARGWWRCAQCDNWKYRGIATYFNDAGRICSACHAASGNPDAGGVCSAGYTASTSINQDEGEL